MGKQQAEKIAKALKNKIIDVAYHTRLSRSKDTLRPVLKYHPECKKVIEDDRMIERNYGIYSGKHHTAFITKVGEEDYRALLHMHLIDHLCGKEREAFIQKVGEAELQVVRRSYTHKAPKGENMPMVEKRVNAFIKDLLKKMRKEKVNVAISAHGNSMRPFRKYFEHLTREKMMQLENPWDDYFEYPIDV